MPQLGGVVLFSKLLLHQKQVCSLVNYVVWRREASWCIRILMVEEHNYLWRYSSLRLDFNANQKSLIYQFSSGNGKSLALKVTCAHTH